MVNIYEIARWIIYNIEDLCLQYMAAESNLPLELYIMNRATVAMRSTYTSKQIAEAFDDHRIQAIINFYEEGPDEQTNTLH